MSTSYTPKQRSGNWLRAGIWSVGFVALLWLSEGIDTLMNHRLDGLGIIPRERDGLDGILFAPLLHLGWGHLIANSIPALVMGYLVLLTGVMRGVQATLLIWLIAGVGTWLIGGTNTIHIGASGLVFGWLTYLIARGIFSRKLSEIAIGIVIAVMYGGLLWGVLPSQPGISWQGHFFGALGGLIAAWMLRPTQSYSAR